MILETYDKELHDKTLRNEGYETGKTAGISSERENGISRFLSALQELNISQRDAYTKLKEKYSLSDEEAEKYLKKILGGSVTLLSILFCRLYHHKQNFHPVWFRMYQPTSVYIRSCEQSAVIRYSLQTQSRTAQYPVP